MKKVIFILFLSSLFVLSSFAQNDSDTVKKELPPDFKSDGCTFFPEGKYKDCCVAHDKAYYFGGSFAKRLKADNQLFKCVAAKKGLYPKLIAPFMWLGVRIGGISVLQTSFRWGFGKNKPKKAAKKKDSQNQLPENKTKN